MPLTRNTQLQLAPEIQISVVGADLLVYAGHRELRCGRDKLALLACFVEPRTMESALEELSANMRIAHEWAALAALVLELVEGGVLVTDDQALPPLAHDARSFGAAAVHIAMLEDRARTQAFLDAIRRQVRPGDVVVDVGTGTGILALAAARAGAARVYAIERSTIADTASAVFRHAGAADRITLVRGSSTQVELPERADLLVSEIIGGEPLAERVLEVTADALARHLKPAARVIPTGLRIFAQPITIPSDALERHVFGPQRVEQWRQRYGLDLSGVLAGESNATRRFFVTPAEANDWVTLAPPAVIAHIDLSAPPQRIDHRAEVTVCDEGRLDGAVVFFELDVDQKRTISTEPSKSDARCSWRCAVYVLGTRSLVRSGDRLALRYSHTLSRTSLEFERR